jgi:hypothetical protein
MDKDPKRYRLAHNDNNDKKDHVMASIVFKKLLVHP